MRYVLLAFGGLSLILGLNFALILLGVAAPLTGRNFEMLHAQFMVFGFLGTLISLERAVAVRKPWAFVAPLGFGLGALLMLTSLPQQVGEALQLVGAIGLVECYRLAWKRVPSVSLGIQILGAVLAVGAAILWLGGTGTPSVVPWISGFIILTIIGERLDLAVISYRSDNAETWALAFSLTAAIGIALSLLWLSIGLVILGCALLALVGWLLQYDIAMKTIHTRGLPRFTAACLLSGYAWLAFVGVMWIVADPLSSAGMYDLTIHAVFIGFGLSMVLGHAPIILPAVLGRPLPYRAIMWLPLVLLQLSLIFRIFVGDLRSVTWAWQVGGVTNVIAILLFFGMAVGSVVLGAKKARGRTKTTASTQVQDHPKSQAVEVDQNEVVPGGLKLLPLVTNDTKDQGES